MTVTTTRIACLAHLTLAGACAAASLLAGCAGAQRASAPAPEARWIRWSHPVFATINRETMFSLAHSPDRATLVIEQSVEGDRYLAAPRTWVISLPESPAMYSPIELAEDGPNNCWVLTRVGGDPVDSFPARGHISILASDAETLTAQVNLSADLSPATAGYAGPSEVALDARFVFQRVTPLTEQPDEPNTASGLPHVKPAPKPKIRQ
jgi:hypothetical protein